MPGHPGSLVRGRCGMVGRREVGEGSGGGTGQGQRGYLRPRKDGGHVSVQATEETHGIGTSTKSLQSTRHAVARSLDRLQDDPQGAPLREDEEGPKGDAVHSSLDGINGALPGRL